MRGVVAISSTISEATGMAQIVRIKGLTAAGRGNLHDLASEIGSAKVQKAVAGMGTGDSASLVDMNVVVGAFLQQIRNRSAFYRLLDSMVRVPFRSRVSMMVADANGWIVGEGKPIPVTRATLNNVYLAAKKAASLMVLTEELLRATQSERNLTEALLRAVAATVDAQFFDLVVDSATPTFSSSGDDAADAVADIRALLEAVAPKVESSLLLVMSSEVQRRAATLTNVSGNFQFPNLTPTGGDILGIPSLPSDQVGEGKVMLLDATGIAGESGEVDIDASANADVEMLASALQQDAITGAGAQLVSMFQTNSIAIRTLVDFDALRLRDDAVAVLTDVNWNVPTT